MKSNIDPTLRHPGQLARDRIHSDLAALAADTETLVRVTACDTRRKARVLRARLGAVSAQARRKCHEIQIRSADTARHAMLTVDCTVRTHRYRAVGTALGIGLLGGWLWRRR